MAIRFHLPALSFLDANGGPVNGAKANFYEAGTTTRLDTYSDEDLTTANANPVVADSAGKFGDIWLKEQAYKVIVTDSDDATIPEGSMDPVNGNLAVTGDKFKVSPQDPADMTISVGAGTLFNLVSKAIVTKAAQTSATITAPVTNPRIDIVYGDRLTGVIGIDTGSEGASPSDPTISDDKVPLARITLATTTTEIGDSLITDIRELANIGTGAAVTKTIGVADGNIPAMDSTGYPAADGSQITNLGVIPDAPKAPPEMSNGTDAAKDIDFTATYCRAENTAVKITNTAMTKQLDASWAAGSAAGGLSSSLHPLAAAAATVHGFAVIIGGAADFLFDTDIACANGIADHTVTAYRRVGSIMTDATPDIIAFVQDGDTFYWDVRPSDEATATPGTDAVILAVSTPAGIVTKAILNLNVQNAQPAYLLITSLNQTATTPTIDYHDCGTSNISSDHEVSEVVRATDTSSQIRYQCTDGSVTDLRIDTIGYIDSRGRDA